MTNIISSLSAVTGYSVGHFMKEKPLVMEISIALAAVLCAAFIGNTICYYLIKYFLNYPVYKSRTDKLILILVISATVTIITIIIEHLKEGKEKLENDLNTIKDKIKREPGNDSISVKMNEGHCLIKCDDLIYLSSHGKKTTFHTTGSDYVANELLKDIEEKLPLYKFIRIHKQFIININYVSQIKYYEGGRYMAYLKDEDESALPVGRKIVPILKEKLRL